MLLIASGRLWLLLMVPIATQVDRLLNKESGLAGLCGTSDWRSVNAAADAGDARAQVARAVFIGRVRKHLGSFLVRLHGDVDALVFTGGIGENDPRLREAVCEGLGRFGIAVDPLKNELGQAEVQPSFARVKVVANPNRPPDCQLHANCQSESPDGLPIDFPIACRLVIAVAC